jgi:hypothetical protein
MRYYPRDPSPFWVEVVIRKAEISRLANTAEKNWYAMEPVRIFRRP